MAITLNGNGTITGYTPPVADGSITAAKLATGVGGKVLQAKHVLKTDTFTTSSGSWNDIPSLNTDITMTNSSNKIIVIVNLCILKENP